MLDGIEYPTVEHAYQAAKSIVPDVREILRLTPKPGNVKRIGGRVPLRGDWEEVKISIMEDLLRQKFAPGTEHHDVLMAEEGEIVEWNNWHDQFWGKCHCLRHKRTGRNELGKILTKIRDEEDERRASRAGA